MLEKTLSELLGVSMAQLEEFRLQMRTSEICVTVPPFVEHLLLVLASNSRYSLNQGDRKPSTFTIHMSETCISWTNVLIRELFPISALPILSFYLKI